MSRSVRPNDLGKDRHSLGTIFGGSIPNQVPDRAVTSLENKILKTHTGLDPLNLEEYSVPFRPAFGGSATKSNSVHLWTNYFTLTVNPTQIIFRYHAQVNPEIKNSRKRHQFFKTVFRDLPEFRELGHDVATDYRAILLTARPLNLRGGDTATFRQTYYEEVGRTARADDTEHTLTVTFVAEHLHRRLMDFIDAKPTDRSDFMAKENAIQNLNIIMANYPNRQDNTYQSGQNKFFQYPDAESYPEFDLQGGLIAVRGYYSSVRCATSRILLNLNAQCSAFYKAINLADLMLEILEHVKGHTQGNVAQWRAVERVIEGLRIKIENPKSASQLNKDSRPTAMPERILTVSSLAYMRQAKVGSDGLQTRDRTGKLEWEGKSDTNPSNARDLSFPYTAIPGENTISVEQYYYKRYGYRIKHATDGFYVVNCGTIDNHLWIPAELGMVVPGQGFHSKLDDTQTSRMLTIAAVPPGDNARRIVAEDGGLGTMGILPQQGSSSRSPALAPFGIQINRTMLVVEGRTLQAPAPMYAKDKAPKMYPGSWSSTGHRFVLPKTLPKWTIIQLTDLEFDDTMLDAFKKAFSEGGMQYEQTLCWDEIKPVVTNPYNNTTLGVMFERLEAAGVRMLLVILPANEQSLYRKMKFWADYKYGIHTVCVQKSKIQDSNTRPDYYANVALKVNLKCGGTNHILRKSDLDFLSKGETMIVGMDVTHPAPEHMKNAPSIAAVVASVDADFAQWPASLRCQESKQEMIEDLEEMMIEHLTIWMSSNNCRKPRNILIYRDGVSEGQYTEVQTKELKQVQAACDFVYGEDVKPKITIVVVGKRHHTRFYPKNEKNADRKNGFNPLPGTVVDRGITSAWLWDFYLQPHAAIKGTAKPGHYVVILDEIKFKADQLEKVTHNLCYLYGRATKAVSIVPPVYYADLACTRGRAYLAEYFARPWPRGTKFEGQVAEQAPWKEGVHPRLRNTMFYV